MGDYVSWFSFSSLLRVATRLKDKAIANSFCLPRCPLPGSFLFSVDYKSGDIRPPGFHVPCKDKGDPWDGGESSSKPGCTSQLPAEPRKLVPLNIGSGTLALGNNPFPSPSPYVLVNPTSLCPPPYKHNLTISSFVPGD